MKTLVVMAALTLGACSAYDVPSGDKAFGGVTRLRAEYGEPVKQVVVLGRTWSVSQSRDKANAYRAVRDNNNLNPFGKPVARRTPQAVRALELATGCRVIAGTLWQNPSAEYFADMACPAT